MTHLGLSKGCQDFIRCCFSATSPGLRDCFIVPLGVDPFSVVRALLEASPTTAWETVSGEMVMVAAFVVSLKDVMINRWHKSAAM